MNDQLTELQRAFDSLPFAARMAAAPFAAKVFALLGALVRDVEALKKAGGLPISTTEEGNGTPTNRRL